MMQGAKGRYGLALGLTLLLGGLVSSAWAGVVVTGNVRVWNTVNNRYEPLPEGRVRLVLGEYNDYDTCDVEDDTDGAGTFRMTKGNAWWRSGYEAYLIVFAEVSGKLEVQSYWGQIDGYQAVSNGFWAADDHTTTVNVTIGGAEDNTRRYQLGGLAAVNNSDTVSATRGTRAFFIYQQMTDHRRQLMAKAPSGGNFEEKEVSYPAGDSTADYTGVLDYIRIPDFYFTDETPARVSCTCRHELSHGIMADEYWTWPGWTYGSFGSHSLWTVAEHREHAWTEAWAEFMAEVTQQPRYGNYNDFETLGASWRSSVPAGADRSRVEGEIASCLWDIYDGVGWEKRAEQIPTIPGEEQFWDGIADGNLDKIWSIFTADSPHSFSHNSNMGSADNFVHYWLGRSSFGLRHELKAILFNRGIQVPELIETPPSVQVGTVTWNGAVARLPLTIREQDAEDRPNVRLEVFVNGTKTYSQWVKTGWAGMTNNVTVEQPIAWMQGLPVPQVVIAVHDNMRAHALGTTLTPPAKAQMAGLAVDVLGVSVSREIAPFGGGNLPVEQQLRNVFVTSQVTADAVGPEVRFPTTGSWTVPGAGDVQMTETRNVYSSSKWPTSVRVKLNARGNDGGSIFNQNLEKTYGYAENFGLGTHTETVYNRQLSYSIGPLLTVRIISRVRVSYRIRPVAVNPLPASAGMMQSLLPSLATLQGAQLATPQLAGGVQLATQNLALKLTGKETPTVLMSRASQLLDEYSRLQARSLEAAEELEQRLTPRAVQPPTPPAPPAGLKLGDLPRGQAVLLKREAVLPSGILKIGPSVFLDRASAGQLALTKLSPEQRQHLLLLRQELAALDQRLTQLAPLSQQLTLALNAAQAKIQQTAGIPPAALQQAKVRLADATGRLATVPPSLAPSRALLQKQLQTIDRGMAVK